MDYFFEINILVIHYQQMLYWNTHVIYPPQKYPVPLAPNGCVYS